MRSALRTIVPFKTLRERMSNQPKQDLDLESIMPAKGNKMTWSILPQMGHACTQARARAQPAYALTSSHFRVAGQSSVGCQARHLHPQSQTRSAPASGSVLGPNLQGRPLTGLLFLASCACAGYELRGFLCPTLQPARPRRTSVPPCRHPGLPSASVDCGRDYPPGRRDVACRCN